MLATLCLALAGPDKFLVVDRLLIGQLKGSRWSRVAETAKSTKSIKLTEIRLAELGGTQQFKGYEPNEAVGGVFINSDKYEPAVYTFGLNPRWPRKPKPLGTDAKPYLDALQSFLSSKGLRAKANLVAAWSIDLDGDGTQEVLLQGSSKGFSREKTASSVKGDYSVVLLRSIGKSGVKTSVLYAGLDGAVGMDYAEVRAIVDLDGDGRMEVLISHDYYEGQNAALFGFRAGKLTKLVDYGAGV